MPQGPPGQFELTGSTNEGSQRTHPSVSRSQGLSACQEGSATPPKALRGKKDPKVHAEASMSGNLWE